MERNGKNCKMLKSMTWLPVESVVVVVAVLGEPFAKDQIHFILIEMNTYVGT